MTFIVGPSRKGSLVSQVYAAIARDAKQSTQKVLKRKPSPADTSGPSRPKEAVQSSPTYERNARKHLTCRHCKAKPLFPQFCHRDQGKGLAIKTDVRLGWVGCGPDPKTSEPGCHWLIGTSGTYSKAERRLMEDEYAASTRAEMEALGLWPKNLPKWRVA